MITIESCLVFRHAHVCANAFCALCVATLQIS